MQCARAIPVAWLGSGTYQNRPSGWILMIMIYIYEGSRLHFGSYITSADTSGYVFLCFVSELCPYSSKLTKARYKILSNCFRFNRISITTKLVREWNTVERHSMYQLIFDLHITSLRNAVWIRSPVLQPTFSTSVPLTHSNLLATPITAYVLQLQFYMYLTL